jgi:DNA-binding transcriptional MerR regulator
MSLPEPAPKADRLLRINEVAAETGLTTRAIRYYEEIGLLEPAARSDGDYRLYDASDLDRLAFIRSLRDDAGFSLAQIGQLLEDEATMIDEARARRGHLDAHLAELDGGDPPHPDRPAPTTTRGRARP